MLVHGTQSPHNDLHATGKGKLSTRMLETMLTQLSSWAQPFVKVACGQSSVKSCRITMTGSEALAFCDTVLAGREAGVRLVVEVKGERGGGSTARLSYPYYYYY